MQVKGLTKPPLCHRLGRHRHHPAIRFPSVGLVVRRPGVEPGPAELPYYILATRLKVDPRMLSLWRASLVLVPQYLSTAVLLYSYCYRSCTAVQPYLSTWVRGYLFITIRDTSLAPPRRLQGAQSGAEGGQTGGSCHRSSAQSCLLVPAATLQKVSFHHNITSDSCGGVRS